jgi:hypothetical protein
MRRKTVWFVALVMLGSAACQRQAFVESDSARPDPSRVREGQLALREDLEELVRVQEAYWSDNEQYALDLERLAFTASPGVLVDVLEAYREGFSALATSESGQAECAVYVGSADPPRSYVRVEGVVACRA